MLKATKSGLSWPTVLKYGTVGGAMMIGLHLMLYSTDALLSSWGPLLMILLPYLFLIVLNLVAMMRLRVFRGVFSLFDAWVHTLTICMLAATVYTAYDYYFNRNIEPHYNEKRLELVLEKNGAEIQRADSLAALGDTILPIKTVQKMKNFQKSAEQALEELRATPVMLSDLLLGNLKLFIIFGMLWGLILGFVTRTKG